MSDKKSTVMVIEDEELLLQAITKKLELNHIEVFACRSGKQAIDYLNEATTLPDAIWLDYTLLDMNGLEFMQFIKNDEKFVHIPVVVVSNSASPTKVHSMLGLGAKKYVLKAEHRLDDIIQTILEFINNEKNTESQQQTDMHA